jgi:hypothetical protein
VPCGFREICHACNRPSPVGFSVPDEAWAAAVPERLRGAPLCIGCFATFADEAGVEWAAQIQFFPVSLVMHQREASDDLRAEYGIAALVRDGERGKYAARRERQWNRISSYP